MRWSQLVINGVLAALVAATLPATASSVSTAQVKATASSIHVATANVREGSAVRHRADMRNADDRAAFARALLGGGARLPDVVLLQEARGSARAVASRLSRHPRARSSDARFRVVVRPRLVDQRGPCDGPRAGRYATLRDSAILVNTRTVKKVGARGTVRTWGRWHAQGAARMGRSGYGCAEHPWVRVSVRQTGKAPRSARILSGHVAPVDSQLKTRAINKIRRTMDAQQRRAPRDLVVIGGDLNQLRCAHAGPETPRCALRGGHRSLRDAGYRDAVRNRHLTGPKGVVGVQGRIDFIYTTGEVLGASFDRCYLAFTVHRDRCSRSRSVFTSSAGLQRCQARATYHGGAGGACPSSRYHRYYSDHPISRATMR